MFAGLWISVHPATVQTALVRRRLIGWEISGSPVRLVSPLHTQCNRPLSTAAKRQPEKHSTVAAQFQSLAIPAAPHIYASSLSTREHRP